MSRLTLGRRSMWRSLPATSGPQVLNLWPLTSDTWIWAMQMIFAFSVEYFLNNFSLFLSGLWKYEHALQLLSYQPAQGRMPIAAWDESNLKIHPQAFQPGCSSGISPKWDCKSVFPSRFWGQHCPIEEETLCFFWLGFLKPDFRIRFLEIWKSILTLPFLLDPFQTLGLTSRFLVSNLHLPFAVPEYTEMESVRSLFH